MQHVDFAREDVDVAVRHGEGNWPGLDAVRLSPEELFPVCSPKLVSGPRAHARARRHPEAPVAAPGGPAELGAVA